MNPAASSAMAPVPASAPAAAQISQLEIKRAAQLSLTEIGLGSLGHGLKIPLTGQILSLNQLAFLLNAVNSDRLPKSSAFEISGIAAVLKSFSPAGQKLGPMLAIAMQGFLFWSGLTVLGAGLLGQLAGATALSLWAFMQPLVTLFFIYGTDLFRVAEFYLQKVRADYASLALSLGAALLSILILKIGLAVALVLCSRRRPLRILPGTLRAPGPLSRAGFTGLPAAEAHAPAPLREALRDLFRPLFLLSFLLMVIFIWQMSGTTAEKIWRSLRPLGIAFVLFYLLRSPWTAGQLQRWAQKSHATARIHAKARAAWKLISEKTTDAP